MTLEELKALEQSATPGPWTIDGDRVDAEPLQIAQCDWMRDPHLISTLRNLAPEILALVEFAETIAGRRGHILLPDNIRAEQVLDADNIRAEQVLDAFNIRAEQVLDAFNAKLAAL